MAFWVLKSTKIARTPGLRPGPQWGSLQCTSRPPSCWEGADPPPDLLGRTRLRLFRPAPGVPQLLYQIYATGVTGQWMLTHDPSIFSLMTADHGMIIIIAVHHKITSNSNVKYVCIILWKNDFFGFPKVKWLQYTGEVGKRTSYWCQIFSGFNTLKFIKIGYFLTELLKKIKRGTFFGTQCI